MKKLLLTTALITSITSAALAKTEGSQVGLDLLRTSASHGSEIKDSSIGFGVNFKYAMPLGNSGVFIAPGLFAEHLNNEAKDADSDPILVKNRFGAKVDVGYDVTDQFAIYVTGGVASTAYEVNWRSVGEKKSGRDLTPVYGLGLSYSATKNLVLNLEYNRQEIDSKTPDIDGFAYKTELDVMKVGVAYRF
jgi:opacity protein-like surface antigen